MPEKAEDEGGLSPTEGENAFRRILDRRASGCFIKINAYRVYSAAAVFSPPRWGGITHISQKIGSEEPIF